VLPKQRIRKKTTIKKSKTTKVPEPILEPAQPMKRVPKIRSISKNHYYEDTQKKAFIANLKATKCSCKDGKCGSDCLNRSMFIECDVAVCGKDCGNTILQVSVLLQLSMSDSNNFHLFRPINCSPAKLRNSMLRQKELAFVRWKISLNLLSFSSTLAKLFSSKRSENECWAFTQKTITTTASRCPAASSLMLIEWDHRVASSIIPAIPIVRWLRFTSMACLEWC